MDDLDLSYSSDYPGRMVPAQRNKDIQLPHIVLSKRARLLRQNRTMGQTPFCSPSFR